MHGHFEPEGVEHGGPCAAGVDDGNVQHDPTERLGFDAELPGERRLIEVEALHGGVDFSFLVCVHALSIRKSLP